MDWKKYTKLHDEHESKMTDTIDKNWKVLGLENIVLKYTKIMIIDQNIKSIITCNIWPTSQFIFWSLKLKTGTCYVLSLIFTAEIDLESLCVCWCISI